MDIPSEVFDEDSDVHWECKRCVLSPTKAGITGRVYFRGGGGQCPLKKFCPPWKFNESLHITTACHPPPDWSIIK